MKSVVRWMLRATFSPPRCKYVANNTCSVITTNSSIYYRTIFEFQSPKGENIMSSIWRDQTEENPSKCLIYLHSLGANQFEVINIIPAICTKDLCVVTFDFPGCGLSGGTILPLDGTGPNLVKSCVDYLVQTFHFTEFVIWGRSMGAAVALHTVSIYPDMFKCIVADSSFACTEKILKDQGRANGFPSFLIKMLMPIIKKEAKDDLKTTVDVPFPIEFVEKAKAPLLQGHGNKDRFVPCEHAKLIFDRYGGSDKQLNFFEGRHNSPRPNSWYETVCRFFYRHLRIQEKLRSYDYIYHITKLHVGPVEQVLPDILRVNEVLRQRELRRNLHTHASVRINGRVQDILTNEENEGKNENEDQKADQNQSEDDNDKNDDYDYDYDYDNGNENTANQSGEIACNQYPQNNSIASIHTHHSLLVPTDPNQTKNNLLDNNSNDQLNPELPIEDSSIAHIKIKEPQYHTNFEQPTARAGTEKNIQNNERRIKDDKRRKSRKVWFDSLSEIGTDIDLGEKINDLNRKEEEMRRREMLDSINNDHHHHHHHRHHHHRIPLSSTRRSYTTTYSKSSTATDISINQDDLGTKPRIKKARSTLMDELPLNSILEDKQ